MNYLAHIFLSGNDRCIQIGNFIGDGVKGDGYKQYPRKFQQGILLHREIDAFSDRHPLVREAVGIGRETFGRYSAVVNDILFDYFLASRFQDYAGLPLKRFSRRFYTALAWNYRHLPERFQGFIWHFILTDRLCRYASLTGIQQSLEIMTRYRGLQIDPAQTPLFMQEHGERLQNIPGVFPGITRKMQTIDLSKVVIPQINYLQTLPDTNTNLYPLFLGKQPDSCISDKRYRYEFFRPDN